MMDSTKTSPSPPVWGEMKQQVGALSHDMSANFVVLEHSFQQLKERVQSQHVPNLSEGAQHVEAYLQESRRLLGTGQDRQRPLGT